MQASQDKDHSRQQEDHPPHFADQHELLARFRERLLAGSFDELIGRGLRRTLRGAATDAGLDTEIGALRLVLVRLLIEEHDPSRLAAGVSRVAGVAVQAARLRNNPDADLDQIRTLMLRELDAVEREFAQDAGTQKEIPRNDAD